MDRHWASRRVSRFTFRLGYRWTISQFRRLEGRTPTRPGWSLPRVAVLAISLMLFGLTIGLAVLAVWLMVRYTNPFTIAVGLIMLLVAAIMLPRPGRVSKTYDRLRREDAPNLHALIDRAAAGVGAPAPGLIVVSAECNASTATIGVRRRKVLHLGLALWGALTPQQRVALLGHELSQFVDGDVRRSLLAEPAMTALGRLAELLAPMPATMLAPRRTDTVGFVTPIGAERMSQLSEGIARLLVVPVALVLRVAQAGVLALVLRDGQRAEYFADHGAARLAGTRAAVDLVDIGVQGAAVETVIASNARAGQTEQGWRAAVAELRERQAPHLHRLRQLSVRREVSLWANHPPHGLRARLLESAPWQDPALVLTEAESDRIDAELEDRYARYRRIIAHNQS